MTLFYVALIVAFLLFATMVLLVVGPQFARFSRNGRVDRDLAALISSLDTKARAQDENAPSREALQSVEIDDLTLLLAARSRPLTAKQRTAIQRINKAFAAERRRPRTQDDTENDEPLGHQPPPEDSLPPPVTGGAAAQEPADDGNRPSPEANKGHGAASSDASDDGSRRLTPRDLVHFFQLAKDVSGDRQFSRMTSLAEAGLLLPSDQAATPDGSGHVPAVQFSDDFRTASPPILELLYELWVNDRSDGSRAGTAFSQAVIDRLGRVEPDPDLRTFWQQVQSPSVDESVSPHVLLGVERSVDLISRFAEDEETVRRRLLDVSQVYLSQRGYGDSPSDPSSSSMDEIVAITEMPRVFMGPAQRSSVILPRLGRPLDTPYRFFGSVDDAGLFMVVHSTPDVIDSVCRMWEGLHAHARLGLAKIHHPSPAKLSVAMRGGLEGSLRKWAEDGVDVRNAIDEHEADLILPASLH